MHVLYYTDPASPESWAAEPARRELERSYDEGVRLRYVMGGLAREFERPLEQLEAWLDAAALSHMPIDPRPWLDLPPKSSYPACLAVAEQHLDGAYLRRAREGIAFTRRRLDTSDSLIELGREVPGLDLARFTVDLNSNAIVEAFGSDLERTRAGAEAALPRLEFEAAGGAVEIVEGARLPEPQAWVEAARRAGARAVHAEPLEPTRAIRRHGRLATAEVAALCDLAPPRAAAELWRLAGELRVRAERHLSGETWTLA